MRFKNYITELSFSKDIDITVQTANPNTFRTLFTVDGVNYIFAANLTQVYTIGKGYGPDTWEIVFVPKGAADDAAIAGKIDAIKVFSAVNKSLMQFVKKYKPRIFKFSPAGPDLAKLYKTLAPKMSRLYSGYTYSYNTSWSEHVFTKK